ncbi:MAG: DUF3306 domain-containing protein [Pseudomonadota bacterium]
MSQDDGFISRWARRKSETQKVEPGKAGGLTRRKPVLDEAPKPVRGRMITDPIALRPADPAPAIEQDGENNSGGLPPVDAAEAEATGTTDAQAAETETSEPLDIEALEKIDIEALDYDADFTPFLQQGVPEALRRRALRRLWNTNPILANVDGLNDYDDDFRDAAMVVEGMKTAWQVGRGYLDDDEVAARDAALAADATDERETIADSDSETLEPSARAEAGDDDKRSADKTADAANASLTETAEPVPDETLADADKATVKST